MGKKASENTKKRVTYARQSQFFQCEITYQKAKSERKKLKREKIDKSEILAQNLEK